MSEQRHQHPQGFDPAARRRGVRLTVTICVLVIVGLMTLLILQHT
ncbi:hypothetical protein [Oleiagrimonas sp. C23AA]|nr:hypothetical protein [Oleiagrimonas sp. C23AA]